VRALVMFPTLVPGMDQRVFAMVLATAPANRLDVGI